MAYDDDGGLAYHNEIVAPSQLGTPTIDCIHNGFTARARSSRIIIHLQYLPHHIPDRRFDKLWRHTEHHSRYTLPTASHG